MGKSKRSRPTKKATKTSFRHDSVTAPQKAVMSRLFIRAGIMDANVRNPVREAELLVKDEIFDDETISEGWAQVVSEAMCLVLAYEVDPLCAALAEAIKHPDASKPSVSDDLKNTLHQLSFDFNVLCTTVVEKPTRRGRSPSPPPPVDDVIRDSVALVLRLEELLTRYGAQYPLSGTTIGIALMDEESSNDDDDDEGYTDDEGDRTDDEGDTDDEEGESLHSEERSEDTDSDSDGKSEAH